MKGATTHFLKSIMNLVIVPKEEIVPWFPLIEWLEERKWLDDPMSQGLVFDRWKNVEIFFLGKWKGVSNLNFMGL